MAAMSLVLLAGCRQQAATDSAAVIGPQTATIGADGRFTPEIMWQLGKLGESALSPDGSQMAYAVTYYDMEQNRGNAELYLLADFDHPGQARRLTTTAVSEWNPVWRDAEHLLFCRGTQIVELTLATGAERVVAEHERGFEGFKLSPDGSHMVYVSTIPVQRPDAIQQLYAGLDQTTGRINEDLMYRHWDNWVDEYPHIYYAPIEDGTVRTDEAVDILGADAPFECPMRPWGGVEQFGFSPDGKLVAYTCRKKSGKDYALSTNSDIYIYNVETGETSNLSEGIMGYDQNPVFSHDGNSIAWESMARDGYESDKLRLMVYDFVSGQRTDYTEQFDYGVSNIRWSDNDRELYAVVMHRGTNEVFAFDVETHAIRQLTHGLHDINAFELAGNQLYATQVSQSAPAEICRYSLDQNEQADGLNLTCINSDALSRLHMGRTEERWIKTTDGKDMLVWLIYPHDYDSTRTYPALLFCEGGPQSMVSQFWSTRWNFQVMSGAGYFVIAPNRRGCPGFGTAWCEEISGDYGGLCMKDYMQSVDVLARDVKQIDPERIGACGASFGAYSIYWLAGHNENHRFKAFLAHNGMFNFEQQCLETEEYWFTNWDLGGPYWEHNAKTAHSYQQSPHRFVDRWNTPLCVVHSEFDFRIVASQGMAAYNAAKLRGLDARYLYFPDETHWVLRPQNSLLWHRNFIDWFDRYLKQ